MKKILLVFGTRPEAIKMAPLVKNFQQYPERFETKVCVTAQHRQMLDQVLSLFEIVPDFDLDIMSQGQDLYDVTSRVLLGMRDVFNKFQPDVVLVHGDTATSTSAALAAFYKQIPVGHVEAGLRTYNIYSPWPEEMNRQLTGRIATYHFAPTSLSQSHLLSEKVDAGAIFVTGNTVIDALQLVRKKIGTDAELAKEQEDFIASKGLPALFEKWRSQERKLILVTGHRRENFGDGFLRICKALKTIAQKYPDADIVYPVHLNPNVQKPVYEILVGQSNIYLIDPLEYLPFVYLMSLSFFVLTDSGGIQEEAPGLGKPVLVMRDTTERPEAVEAGTVLLVGTDTELIVSKASQLINEPEFYQTMSKAVNPYGDGFACQRIVDLLS